MKIVLESTCGKIKLKNVALGHILGMSIRKKRFYRNLDNIHEVTFSGSQIVIFAFVTSPYCNCYNCDKCDIISTVVINSNV